MFHDVRSPQGKDQDMAVRRGRPRGSLGLPFHTGGLPHAQYVSSHGCEANQCVPRGSAPTEAQGPLELKNEVKIRRNTYCVGLADSSLKFSSNLAHLLAKFAEQENFHLMRVFSSMKQEKRIDILAALPPSKAKEVCRPPPTTPARPFPPAIYLELP
jgi:hypothetical protein